jgi:hypothetical protein
MALTATASDDLRPIEATCVRHEISSLLNEDQSYFRNRE